MMNKKFLHFLIPFVVSLSNHERNYLLKIKPIFSDKYSNSGFDRLSPNGVFFGILLVCFIGNSYAVDVYQLPDPEQQKTYESIISELRCLVCQNQTIADSNAELAADLRRQVYEMLQQGKTKAEIQQFMTERYGDFVLYNPPLKSKTALLWLGPVAFLLLGFIVIFLFIRHKKQLAVSVPDQDKLNQAHQLLFNDQEGGKQP